MTHDTPTKRIWVIEYPGEAVPRSGEWVAEQSDAPEGANSYTLTSEAEAMVAAALREQEQNYLHLHNAAFDVWRWFETARPDLIGPRAEKLRDALMGPRPYGTADQPASAALDKLIAEAEARGLERAAQWHDDQITEMQLGADMTSKHLDEAIADHQEAAAAIRAANGEAK